jgi:hypothetical protein
MQSAEAKPQTRRFRVPAEIVNIFGTAGAIFAVVAVGDILSRVAPAPGSVWLTAAAYGAPAAAVFAVYCWISRRF